MDVTEKLRKKYPNDEVIENVRKRLGLSEDDASMDDHILKMSRNEVFAHVVNWNGLINYDSTIKYWVLDIYGVDLDEVE
ncbi:hypothetical protein Q7A53_05690 [Halobacillus rhizosphaerae]|uniref:hypothetical protein n=1 Tax=Halobacillus rhizosphaerae TaxID=3064889 RepID=UPI00398B7D37